MKSVQIRIFFWSVFSCIRIEYGDLLLKSPYSIQIQDNKDQKKLRMWTLFTQCCSMKYVQISALVFGSSPIPLVRTCTLLGYPFPHVRCKQETSLPTTPSPRIHTLLPSTSSFQYTRNLDIIKCSKLPICFIIFLPLRKKIPQLQH